MDDLGRLEQRMLDMERRFISQPSRPVGGGGGGITISEVTNLPTIPARGSRIVFWLNAANGGTGNNRHWITNSRLSRWYCVDGWSDSNGAPGS